MRRLLFILAAAALCADAHVGSPDIFLEGSAGPYPMFVTIRPPSVIPGVAEIEVRNPSGDIEAIRITPTPMTGEASTRPPTPDSMHRSKDDAHFFTGSLWIMASGSWQVRLLATGAKGEGQLSIPVPAVASRTKPMQKAMGIGLLVMTIILALGLVSIMGASEREASLAPGEVPDQRLKSRARILMGATAAVVIFALWAGNQWWISEANDYAGYIYKPLDMSAQIQSGDKLNLTLKETAWRLHRSLDEFLPDHGHRMHLYVIAEPDANHVWHLHPDFAGAGVFTQSLPAMPPGRYKLYADVVHRSGFAETAVAELNLPAAIAGHPQVGDDAGGVRGESHIEWVRDSSPIVAREPSLFKFRLRDGGTELYMGMLGHAAFVKNDGTVFAHVHPSGSVPMAAFTLANPSLMDHSMHEATGALPAEVAFPYGFPSPGDYRIIVQMKHAGVIETGIFDAVVQ